LLSIASIFLPPFKQGLVKHGFVVTGILQVAPVKLDVQAQLKIVPEGVQVPFLRVV
jgi:hypothetical protein